MTTSDRPDQPGEDPSGTGTNTPDSGTAGSRRARPPAPARSEAARLPLRAGAMLLLAIAVVFTGLGWHSAATGDSDPGAGLEAAQSRQPTSSAPATTTPGGAETSASSSQSSSVDPDRPRVCIFNAGIVGGLGQTYRKLVDDAGWTTATPSNLQSASITENTIFYTATQQEYADQLAEELGGDISVDPRPSAFSQCQGGLVLIVVTR